MFANSIKTIGYKLGFDIKRNGIVRLARQRVGDSCYEHVFPNATYAPWITSQSFIHTYQNIRHNTFVDKFRCFELWELIAQVAHLPGNVVEVGAWRGGSGCLLAARVKSQGLKKVVYLCDTFAGVVKASDKDNFYVGGEHSDTTEAEVVRLIKSMDLQNVVIKKGIFPDDCREEMEGEKFNFAHIDVDVYWSAKDVMSFVWPRMPVGGIVVFDDFGFIVCAGIPKLVEEYRGDTDKVILHNLNGHAVLVKTA
jgi:O-methyltransferase